MTLQFLAKSYETPINHRFVSIPISLLFKAVKTIQIHDLSEITFLKPTQFQNSLVKNYKPVSDC